MDEAPLPELTTLHRDIVQPFIIHASNVRGRFVRLGEVTDTIIRRHEYPEAVSCLLAELLTLAAMLSSNLKSGGIFTIQVKGNGPVSLMVVDSAHDGGLRGYADLVEGGREFIEKQMEHSDQLGVPDLLGEGYLAITFDPGVHGQRYQGIVELTGDSLTDAITHYFTNSQQIEVSVKLAVGKYLDPAELKETWFAGGIMIERLPEDEGDEEGHSNTVSIRPQGDEWDYAYALLQTVQAHELIDPWLSPSELLFRLYNEEGVWVYDPANIGIGCRCSREKIAGILRTIDRGELESMKVDGVLTVNCQFCNKSEVFDGGNIDQMFSEHRDSLK